MGKSRPTSKGRNKRQKLKQAYAKTREEAQLRGLIPTTPEGAVRNEVVDPRKQTSQQLPEVVREALRENWATPDIAKPTIVGALLEPFFSQDVVLDKDGNQIRVPPSRGLLLENAKVLRLLDQTQYERDNPVEAGKAKGGGNIQQQAIVINPTEEYMRQLREADKGEIEDRLEKEQTNVEHIVEGDH